MLPGADALDDADALVAGDERRRRLDRPLAAGGVDVGVAEPAGLDADEHLLRSRDRDREVLDLERTVEATDDGGFHGAPRGRRSGIREEGGIRATLRSSRAREQVRQVGARAARQRDHGALRLAHQRAARAAEDDGVQRSVAARADEQEVELGALRRPARATDGPRARRPRPRRRRDAGDGLVEVLADLGLDVAARRRCSSVRPSARARRRRRTGSR